MNDGVEGLWGLAVDRVMQTAQIPKGLIMPLPPIGVNPKEDYFDGVIRLDEQLVLFLAPERMHPDAHMSSRGEPSQSNVIRNNAEEAVVDDLESISISKPLDDSSNGHNQKQGQVVMFYLSDQGNQDGAISFGLSITQIPEILEPLPSIPVPSAPSFVLGLLNWRDRPVPLIDLPARLNLPSTDIPSTNGRSRLLIVRDKSRNGFVSNPTNGRFTKNDLSQGVLGAFLIQPSIRIKNLPIDHQPGNLAHPIRQQLIRGVVELENETLLVPDIQTILGRDN
jgi:chemotaxis signal transduction protein